MDTPRSRRHVPEALAEWLPFAPSLLLHQALPLYLAAALLPLLALLILPGQFGSLKATLRRVARFQIGLVGIILILLIVIPLLLIPGGVLATPRLLVALVLSPIVNNPVWILAALCLIRSVRTWFGLCKAPTGQP